ncbi:cupredoxin domain-containing protein [Tranquillimonas alkanivorans]|uniref:Uncharacterized copper-binding protein, cupredoxin-like subfamily n=1 Tax=Tranquillimonas alkanivorans TaxID=441119 RepID=A0A1I5V5G5_9RHOB|nr:cupredoxin family protein [Tranquillimonas alkanivorans]SFQ02587.1 Uncharacterized copper-binding protein, cupredoxin-like subfamily [Tranquillimonas alkanivorans]
MSRKLIGAAALSLITGAAVASGTHTAPHHEEMAAGRPGEAAEATRVVEMTMRELDNGEMVFEPSELFFAEGETVRFVVSNEGLAEHEFVLDSHAKNGEHMELMARFPEMEHDDPNSVRLEPGETGEIIWTFSKAGGFEFACLLPGHYESGMQGPILVN